MKKFILIIALVCGCGGPTSDIDYALEDQVQEAFARDVPSDDGRLHEGYHRITDCMAVTWALNVRELGVFLTAYAGNVCPYSIFYFAPTDSGAGNVVLHFANDVESVGWCYREQWLENAEIVWREVELNPGEVRPVGTRVRPIAGESWIDGVNRLVIAWPRPGDTFHELCRDHDETSHIFKTYQVEFTEEELEFLSGRYK